METFLRKHLWVVNLLSLALAAFFLATGTGALLSLLLIGEPEAEAAGPALRAPRLKRNATKRFVKRDGRTICAENIFNYKVRPCAEDAVDPEDLDDSDEITNDGVPPYCSGDCQLVATMASSDPEWSFAMIKSEGKTMPYRAGNEVKGVGKVQRVGWRLVLLDADDGPDCLLDLYPPSEESASRRPGPALRSKAEPPGGPHSARRGLSPDLEKQIDSGIEVVSATERNIDRGLVESLIENSSSLMSQARILPYERDGSVQGFKLYGIRRNSLLGKLGLRNGDIVNSIGGIDMTSPDRALEAYSKLRNVGNLTVTFTRRGRRETMDYNIR